MQRPKLIWQLFPSHILILLGVMLAIAWHGSHSLRQFYVDQMVTDLKAQSLLLEPRVSELLADNTELISFCRESGRRISSRITVIGLDGKVACDSMHNPATMSNHADRPEIIQAYGNRVGTAQRYSATTQQEMLYVAIPVQGQGGPEAVLRTAIPLTAIDQALSGLFSRSTLGLIVVLLLAAGITLAVSRQVSRPLEMMRQGTVRFANGDFSQKITVSGSEEIVGLAQTMNRMAAQLDDRIRTVSSQRNEMETVLSSMVEGVIAVDLNEKILYMNGAARKQLGADQQAVHGRTILEIVRNMDLLRFIQDTLQQDDPIEGTVVFNRGREEERFLQVHGAQLADATQNRIGALVVTNDVTRLLRLENMRRDFVANVSHELRTPVTSIKGYVETLLDEAGELPAHMRDFLGVIRKQTNRLQAIIEDLLALSQIERDQEEDAITLTRDDLVPVLHAAVEACSGKAAEKDIEISLRTPDQVMARINAPLLEQALVNLIDNAIKYSDPGSNVLVGSNKDSKGIEILVRDTGPGIAERHLPRLFERFYIVDKARSRKLGGTGLGLAIVKHIAKAHHGRVSVASTFGQGSTFTIHLPGRDGF